MNRIDHYPWHRSYPWAWLTRLVCAWMVLRGHWSLHRAWQEGYEQHVRDDNLRRALGQDRLSGRIAEAIRGKWSDRFGMIDDIAAVAARTAMEEPHDRTC